MGELRYCTGTVQYSTCTHYGDAAAGWRVDARRHAGRVPDAGGPRLHGEALHWQRRLPR